MIAQSAASVNPVPKNNVIRLPLTVGAAAIAVRKIRGLTIAEKGLLHTIAAHMPDCRPSVRLLVEETGASRPQLFKLMRGLEAKGHLRRTRRGGRYGTNAYELVFQPAERSPGETQGSLLETPEGSLLETQGGKGEKRQDQKRAEGELRRSDRKPGPAPTTTTPPPSEPVPQPVTVLRPPAQAEPGHRVVGDRDPETPPASGRFELPDVCSAEPATVDREVEAMRGRRDRGEALVAEPKHLVAGYAAAYESVYGFPPVELAGSKVWKCAVSRAQKLVDGFFGGDAGRAERYVGWVWERERRARRAGKHRDRPIGWQLMFGQMVGDYLKCMADWERKAA